MRSLIDRSSCWETMASVYRTAQNRQGGPPQVPKNATAALVGAAAAETFSAKSSCGSPQRADAVFGWKRWIATRQAGEMWARLENRQAPTRSRSGMN